MRLRGNSCRANEQVRGTAHEGTAHVLRRARQPQVLRRTRELHTSESSCGVMGPRVKVFTETELEACGPGFQT